MPQTKASVLTPVSPSFRDRFHALTPRERLYLAVGAGAILLFPIFLLLPSTGTEESVEIAAAPPPAAVAPAPVYATPPPPAPPPTASAGGLLLRGVLGSGAIIAFPAGGERLVPLGREFLPGLILKSVGVHHAIIGGAGGDMRLELGKAGAIAVASQPGTVATAPAAGASVAAQQRETIDYRLGLQPVETDGRVTGFAIKPGASLPQLARAGLQPGDVIVGVNGGGGFNEEQVMELAWTIANSPRTEFEFVRNGKRMKAALEPNRTAQ